MALNAKKGEPEVAWPFEERQADVVPEPYKLTTERNTRLPDADQGMCLDC